MPRIHIFLIACLLITLPVVEAARIPLQVEGLPGDLNKNLCERLSTIATNIATNKVYNDSWFRARVSEAIQQELKTLGYYNPNITFELRSTELQDGRTVLIAHVKLGEPVKIVGSSILLKGDALYDPDYHDWVKKGTPIVGRQLIHAEYNKFKSGFTKLALRNGYFDGNFKKSQLGVSIERHEAFWDIDYDSGQRYRFGEVNFSGLHIRKEYLEKLVPFKKGEYYSAKNLAELNRRLSATGWFNSVVITPEFKIGQKTKILPLNTMVSPRTKNTVETGVGYSTGVGPRLKIIWKKPWVNDMGHSLVASTYLSTPEQQLDLRYRIPLLKNPLEQYYLFSGGLKRTDLNDTHSDTTMFGVSRYWENSSGWQNGINLRWSCDYFTQGSVTNNSMLLYPGILLNRTRSRGGLMPTWGDSQHYWLYVSDTTWGSNIDFLIFQAQHVWIRTVAEKHRFVLRGNFGWIGTNDFEKVPSDLRFFAGGDRSIRGYKYKNISPHDENGKLTGASKLFIGSLEYQQNIFDKWWGAVFIDSGIAVNDIKQSNFKTGAGFGLRWVSPVGPIKLDISSPIGNGKNYSLQVYIGLGPEL